MLGAVHPTVRLLHPAGAAVAFLGFAAGSFTLAGSGRAAEPPVLVAKASSPTPSPEPTATPEPLPSGLSADDIFFRARQVSSTRVQPKFVEYRIDSSYQHEGRLFVDKFDMRYRNRDDKVVGYTIPLSPEEDRKRLAGINILIFEVALGDVNPNHNPIVVHVPLLSPVNDFGLAVAPPSPVPGQTSPPGPPLPEIGRVLTRTHEYDVTYVGMQTVDGARTYHLKLKPAKDAKDAWKLRLRDVWVNAATYAVPQLETHGILDERPYDRVTWRVNYQDVDGAWVIHRVSTDDDLNFGDFLARNDINGMALAFGNFTFPTDVPTALFDLAIP